MIFYLYDCELFFHKRIYKKLWSKVSYLIGLKSFSGELKLSGLSCWFKSLFSSPGSWLEVKDFRLVLESGSLVCWLEVHYSGEER